MQKTLKSIILIIPANIKILFTKIVKLLKKLKNINIDVKKNEILCIMGQSGCGKSTLLSLINGFLEENGGKYTGEVILNGQNIKLMKLINLRIQSLFLCL